MKKFALILFCLTLLTACSQSEAETSSSSAAPLLIYQVFFDQFERLSGRELYYALMPDGSVYGSKDDDDEFQKFHAEWERNSEKQITLFMGDGMRLRYNHIGEARDGTQVWQMSFVGEFTDTRLLFAIMQAQDFTPENWKEFR